MMPTKADQYRSKAKECKELAERFADCEVQKMLQEVADKLFKRAEETERAGAR